MYTTKKGMRYMNKQKLTKRQKFFKWIHNHRTKLGIWSFLVILPLALILTAYVGSYTSNKSVYFDSEITEDSEKIKAFLEADKLKALNISIEWEALKKPINDDNGNLISDDPDTFLNERRETERKGNSFNTNFGIEYYINKSSFLIGVAVSATSQPFLDISSSVFT